MTELPKTNPCIHLGVIVKYSCCGSPSLHECKLHLDQFTRPRGGPWNDKEISCCTCKQYQSAIQ